VLATVAILSYSAFFYHYPDFPAPWLAIAVGAAAGALSAADGPAGVAAEAAADRVRRGLAALAAVAILAVAGLETYELAPASVPGSPPAAALIPAGSCLVADQISFAIAAGEFAAPRPGCPDVVDSLAVTLSLSGGASPQGGAGNQPKVIAGWEAIFGKAQYVWLSGGARQRIPWNHALRTWFGDHFRELAGLRGYGDSKIYVRDR
jgi:hypothetical protein